MKTILSVLAIAALFAIGTLRAGEQRRDGRFEAAIFRDLKQQHPQLTRIEAQLLRDEPTITGIAVPKYYLWARLFAKDRQFDAAAIRLADDADAVHILQIIDREAIRRQPDTLHSVFPAVLVPKILALAEDRIAPTP